MSYPSDETFEEARRHRMPPAATAAGKAKKPKIVYLCGSTKFRKEFEEVNKQETLNGNIVLTVGFFGHSDNMIITKQQKEMLDKLHLRKIDLAEEVIVINKGNYIGHSTANEIVYALKHGKNIRYLEENKNNDT